MIDYIANTGISDIRASIAEEERDKGLQEQARDRMHPKLHRMAISLSLITISEPTRLLSTSYAAFCLKKKKEKRRLIEKKCNEEIKKSICRRRHK